MSDLPPPSRRCRPALLLMLAATSLQGELLLVPAASPQVALEVLPDTARVDASMQDPTWPVVYRGGASRERLGPARIRWGRRDAPEAGWRHEVFFAGSPQGKQRWVLHRDRQAGTTEVALRIPAPPGGEPRAYASDRDDLVAFTVDYGTWDTCPEVRALREDGLETIPLPCPEAGRQALEALQRADALPAGQDARARMRFRLTNIRYRDPGFLSAGGVDLDAEVRLRAPGGRAEQVHPVRFELRDGRVVRAEVTGPPAR